MRQLANTGKIEFVDMHLSHVAQVVMEGFLGPIDFAIIGATEITPQLMQATIEIVSYRVGGAEL